ncbi:MAG: hypothetical protein B7X76_06685 [Azorhizobium sp. 39-67-5]|nr:MAG: hypothetical protein B7X76_06685 [Azorhizobium sp. 39-67-5]
MARGAKGDVEIETLSVRQIEAAVQLEAQRAQETHGFKIVSGPEGKLKVCSTDATKLYTRK